MPELTSPSPQLSDSAGDDELLPIRDVVRLTEVNPVTLRAWERRYGLIQPLRTEGGHRLYSQQDVATIRDIMAWTERGIAVSKVGELLEHSRSLAARTAQRAEASDGSAAAGEDSLVLGWKHDLRQAVATFDLSRLQQLYGQISASDTLSSQFEHLLMPVWYELLHQSGFGQRSQWLFYDAFLRTCVLQRPRPTSHPAQPVALLAALPEQCRELELLVTGLFLEAEKSGDAKGTRKELHDKAFAVRVLAPGQPLDELPLLCQTIGPQVLVLFAPVPVTAAQRHNLERLVLAINCPLALAGVGAELSADALRGTPIACLGAQPALMRQRMHQFVDGHLDT